MARKITVKRLSASDLTFFDTHYKKTLGTKQKAFNLDRAILVDSLFPSLPELAEVGHVPLSLTLHGPGLYGPQQLMRKIIKQQKNWRLDGETIHDPEDQEGRFDALSKGDFAIIEFSGDAQPIAAQVFLISAAVREDAELHAELRTAYGLQLNPRRGMVVPDPDHLTLVIQRADLRPTHPVTALLDADSLEDAVQGGLSGLLNLRRRRGSRGVTKEEFADNRKRAERIGRLGEELLDRHFSAQRELELIQDYSWVSDMDAISPYDFTIQTVSKATGNSVSAVPTSGQVSDEGPTSRYKPVVDGHVRYLDAKSTSGDFSNPIHVSIAELHEMANRGANYDIYRLYEVREHSAKLSVAVGVGDFATKVLSSFKDLPPGVTIDGVSVKPAQLPFDANMDKKIDFTNKDDNFPVVGDPGALDDT